MPDFETKRPPSSLLIPKKRPLKTKSSSLLSKTYSTEKHTPSLYFTSTSTEQDPKNRTVNKDRGASAATTTEFNFSLPPQPFLDPGCWERIRASSSSRLGGEGGSGSGSGGRNGLQLNEKEKEEERRRRRAREAEYGGMAVRGRIR
ncbi:hypothetical protein BDQ94DRAFT_132584 [Aspergillus welwitschiae]|uniref:Uncharacterized protein n=1 Tax=Aspergillus welwitschiae TaxID=1341132 RepID=A0A3F3QJ97_9EURO|nr:hypothetical protein BDQ94DRAFT_132584 [Aspergillus welwitschiae]RDH39185.1 hypothetical protein BDQ94DRAFT_132584 [Aspergillus welwitschiae]